MYFHRTTANGLGSRFSNIAVTKQKKYLKEKKHENIRKKLKKIFGKKKKIKREIRKRLKYFKMWKIFKVAVIK